MDHNHSHTVVTRFAPSPTGFLHIGSARTALFAWLWARKNNGTFILRIEDTDKAREVEGSIQHIQDSLSWLEIDWDFGPDKPSDDFGSCLQSDRLDIYKEWAMKLVRKGLAYPDPYTQEELEGFREKAKIENRPFLFRDHRPEEVGEWDGTQPLRFKTPEVKRMEWHDEARGDLSAGPEMLDDFIIIKADGYPTYNFAHIIDDHLMGVTHVMRGEEFISSTPKFVSLIDALEVPRPKFVTLPPIMGPDGKKKLSKRDGAKDLLEYGDDGYLPEALRNFLALIGWNPGGDRELFFDVQELIEAFSLGKIQKSGGAFNIEKLNWMNKEHIEKMPSESQVQYVLNSLPDKDSEILAKLTPTILERVHTKKEIQQAAEAGEYDWAFTVPEYKTELLKWKNAESVTESLPRLQKVSEMLTGANFASPETIKEAVWGYADKEGRGEVLWPLRVSLTGRERSPDPFTCAYILGQAETLSRINSACDKIEA